MKQIALAAMLLLVLTTLGSAAGSPDVQTVMGQLAKLAPGGKTVPCKGLVIQRDAATIRLQQGRLCLCQPVAGRACAILFVGQGFFRMTPPIAPERDQLARLYDRDSLVEEFDQLFMIVDDSTIAGLGKSLAQPDTAAIGDAQDRIAECVKYLVDQNDGDADPHVIKSLLDNQGPGLFYAQVNTRGLGALFYEIDPYSYEEVSLSRPSKEFNFHHLKETICQFHPRQDALPVTETSPEQRQPIRITGYAIDCSVSGGLDFGASSRVEFISQRDQQWVYFNLYDEITIDSVKGPDGGALPSFKGKKSPTLWVRMPAPLSPQQTCTLTVHYQGSIFEKYYNWIYIKTSIFWYPWGDNKSRATFDVTYHVPDKYDFISVGTKVADETRNGIRTTRWVSDTPIRNFTFDLGYFREYKIEDKRIPPITLLLAKAHSDVPDIDRNVYYVKGKNMEKQVGADIANSLSFFQHVYGPSSCGRFYAVEIPGGGGESFPGLINLSRATYQRTDEEGGDEILRAHEVAHQWWASGADFESYHDQWLSEGLSEFSGLWYMQQVLKDNKKYFAWLDRFKDDIINNRTFLLSRGKRSGAIWLGYRSATSETENDYGVVVYQKGAWVMHLLRNMMMDLNTTQETKFIDLLHDVYAAHRDTLLSTERFQRLVERHMGMDMGWFFQQWVYGTEIPSYVFSYKYAVTPEGKYRVTCRVEQNGVSPGFQTYLPLFIDFGGKQIARLRVMIKGPRSEFDLPLLPLKPVSIKCNEYQSLLGKVEEIPWKE